MCELTGTNKFESNWTAYLEGYKKYHFQTGGQCVKDSIEKNSSIPTDIQECLLYYYSGKKESIDIFLAGHATKTRITPLRDLVKSEEGIQHLKSIIMSLY